MDHAGRKKKKERSREREEIGFLHVQLRVVDRIPQ
jgi:hypothetical protein